MASQAKIYQLWVFDGNMKWHVSASFPTEYEAQAEFNYVTNDDFPNRFNGKPHHKDWSNFSCKIINKKTGEVLKRHVGTGARYARND